jgi:hypothetical protein
VCLVEKKKKAEVGEKICGDALGEHHLKTLGLEKPQGGELEKRIEGIRIFSPDENTIFTIAHEDFIGYMLNRRLFGQWLLNKAVDSGATLMDSTWFLKPILEKGFIKGISAKPCSCEVRLWWMQAASTVWFDIGFLWNWVLNVKSQMRMWKPVTGRYGSLSSEAKTPNTATSI